MSFEITKRVPLYAVQLHRETETCTPPLHSTSVSVTCAGKHVAVSTIIVTKHVPIVNGNQWYCYRHLSLTLEYMELKLEKIKKISHDCPT